MTLSSQIRDVGRGVEELARCVAALSDELFLERLNGWSPRDIVAHLIGWNRAVIEGSRQIMRGELPFYDIDPGEDYSRVNAGFVREYSSRRKEELLAELRSSAGELQDHLRSLEPRAWARDYGVRHRGSAVTIQDTVAELIEDYVHHRRQVEDWSGSAGERPGPGGR